MGLTGFYLVEDEEERSLRLPREHYDIPLMLCMRQFNDDGSFRYNPHGHSGADSDVILVNGRGMACFTSRAREVSLPHSERLQRHNLHSRP